MIPSCQARMMNPVRVSQLALEPSNQMIFQSFFHILSVSYSSNHASRSVCQSVNSALASTFTVVGSLTEGAVSFEHRFTFDPLNDLIAGHIAVFVCWVDLGCTVMQSRLIENPFFFFFLFNRLVVLLSGHRVSSCDQRATDLEADSLAGTVTVKV